MNKVLVSREASQDLDLIYDKIGQDNPPAAKRVVDEALKLFSRLGRTPELGRKRPFPKPFADLRSFTIVRFSNYVVFYRLRDAEQSRSFGCSQEPDNLRRYLEARSLNDVINNQTTTSHLGPEPTIVPPSER